MAGPSPALRGPPLTCRNFGVSRLACKLRRRGRRRRRTRGREGSLAAPKSGLLRALLPERRRRRRPAAASRHQPPAGRDKGTRATARRRHRGDWQSSASPSPLRQPLSRRSQARRRQEKRGNEWRGGEAAAAALLRPALYTAPIILLLLLSAARRRRPSPGSRCCCCCCCALAWPRCSGRSTIPAAAPPRSISSLPRNAAWTGPAGATAPPGPIRAPDSSSPPIPGSRGRRPKAGWAASGAHLHANVQTSTWGADGAGAFLGGGGAPSRHPTPEGLAAGKDPRRGAGGKAPRPLSARGGFALAQASCRCWTPLPFVQMVPSQQMQAEPRLLGKQPRCSKMG
nr:PREDICTED: translation initiation factor IF-2-like [Anolis carolinensis]|eukprot:XP_016849176.1 PREDICTED: translation initiation factor IF-2-like [Anolis carolinensis]